MSKNKPTLRKGPASSYASPNEVIREFGDGTGNGGLLSIRKLEAGTLVVEIYSVSGPVLIHAPGTGRQQRSEAPDDGDMVSLAEVFGDAIAYRTNSGEGSDDDEDEATAERFEALARRLGLVPFNI